MNMFFKICAGALSTLALTAGVVLAIPPTRNFIFDAVAPHSQVYQEKEKENDELNQAYLNNLVLLTETRTSLINAEFKAISYQNEVGVLQSNLITSQNNLALALSQKSQIQASLDMANQNLSNMSVELSNMREQFRQLNIELDIMLDTQSDNTARIEELNNEISTLSTEIANLDSIVSGLQIATDSYEAQIAEYEAQIATGNQQIQDYETEIISLRSQIVELQETIKSLEAVNNALNGDDSYKQLFQSIIGGTITELKASDLEGVTEIRAYAFYNCHSLQRVELPETVETIGSYAFANCSNLEEVITTNNLKTINTHAFYNCPNLKTVNFSNIETMGSFAFNNTGLEEIRLPANVSNWGSCVFQNSSISVVYIEEGATNIPFGLLHGCGGLTEIYLPSTLQTIDTFGISNYSSGVNIFFAGTQEQFDQITYDASDNTAFANANVVCNYPVPTNS
ncbi:MAG: leucine-rich repeat protein [Clostridia bacterium]|nr:leucine-rich repeat protein [Clostridia bacterium]